MSATDSVTPRLTKAAKQAVKFERVKENRTQLRKIQRHEKTSKQREIWAALTEEERTLLKQATKDGKLEEEQRLQWALNHGLNVCIDLSYESEHSDKEKRSLCKQLQLSYSLLKRLPVPIHLHITSLGTLSDQTRAMIQTQGINGWKVDRHDQVPSEIFPKERLIYLSPDAEQALESFDESSVYVVGGIVDRSVRKACTLNRASEENVKVMRLPIQEYMPGRSSHILNIDAVIHTICKFSEEKDWMKTFLETMPLRKQSTVSKSCKATAPTSEAEQEKSDR